VNQAETEATTTSRRVRRRNTAPHLLVPTPRGFAVTRDPGGEDERRGCRREGGGRARPARVEEAGAEPEGDREPPRGGDLRRAARVRHGPRRGGQSPPLPRFASVSPCLPPPHRFIACLAVPSPVIASLDL
jgi:hypothetical protein